jgi:hypothetical protein
VLDPPVIGVAGEARALRRPADPADGAGELPLVGARGGAGRRAGARAVEGDDGRGEIDNPGDGGRDIDEPPRSGNDRAPTHRAAVKSLAPPADVDADRCHRLATR